jgi:hypothetical protein
VLVLRCQTASKVSAADKGKNNESTNRQQGVKLPTVIYEGESKLCIWIAALRIVSSGQLMSEFFAENSPSSLLAETRCSADCSGGE